MSCCPPTIIPFSNVPFSEFGYSELMRTQHGSVPKVEVLYFDTETNEFYLSTSQSTVTLSGNPVNNVYVDHGGPNSGVIKLI